ncbi:acyl-CoA thioesterase [Chitinimonas koreensis]|uniref:acyl-CoA thioesterase n=1 Tax=Chitinimonas koreensis TaxID=356302 RepID=UPI000423CF3B|nr:acyl-CoA thioesterase [Chitinimonas koreensis]QNM98669.1 thioesterase family protein [Chitinimonas koreensis]
MNLYLRMVYVFLLSLFRPRLPVGRTHSELGLMTFPNDLDVNLHVNNGRYLTYCDLNRVDLFIRTGLLKTMGKHGWIPIIAEHTMTYRKSLKAFRRFKASMELTHWDEKYFYMTHRFSIGDTLIAEGTSKGVVRGKEGVIAPERVIEAVHAIRGTA